MIAACRLARQGAGTARMRQHPHQPPVPAFPAAHPLPRGFWRPAAVFCAATRLETAAQELSASGTATDARAAAGNGSATHSQHSLDSVPADVLTDNDSAMAERRASGRLASTSGGGQVDPVAAARCHTLAAEVRHICTPTIVLRHSAAVGWRRCKPQSESLQPGNPVSISQICMQSSSVAVQMSFAEAVAALKAAVERGGRRYGAFASGVVRWEVPLPRDANALQWLQVRPSPRTASSTRLRAWHNASMHHLAR